MKEIKREVTTKQTVYELTKEELEKIKHDARIEGRYDILKYFCFALQNYRYELNIKGLQKLVMNIVDFVSDKTNIIENVYGYSFRDFVKYER